jgi:hypothetical protein
MVGFRNIAIHDYQSLDVDILKSILSKHPKTSNNSTPPFLPFLISPQKKPINSNCRSNGIAFWQIKALATSDLPDQKDLFVPSPGDWLGPF